MDSAEMAAMITCASVIAAETALLALIAETVIGRLGASAADTVDVALMAVIGMMEWPIEIRAALTVAVALMAPLKIPWRWIAADTELLARIAVAGIVRCARRLPETVAVAAIAAVTMCRFALMDPTTLDVALIAAGTMLKTLASMMKAPLPSSRRNLDVPSSCTR
jgi:hypothetical protein